MQSIEEKAIETYQKNITFLEEKHFDVWRKIYNFETALSQGKKEERYALDFKEEYFDVVELSSQNYLYSQNSDFVAKELAKKVNFKKNSMLFDGFPMFYGYEKHKDKFDDKAEGMEGIYPLMSYYLENINPTDEMIEIEKFIFIGAGLGGHILEIDKKIDAEEYFIIEDDLELFRLSLFTTPYYTLQKKTLFFSIEENKEDFTTRFKNFLQNSFFRNKYLKYLHFPAHSKEKIKLIKNVLSSQVFSSFPYKTNLKKYIRALHYLNSGYHFLNLNNRFQNNTLAKKPLLVIAAGPSLDENLEWLKKNHKKFIILALSATLKLLNKHNICPDIVTHLDGFKASVKHLKGFETKEFLKESVAIVGSFTPLEVLQHFTKENIYIVEEHTTYYNKDFYAYSGPCVGSTSIMWATIMDFKEIYLLGIDFALSKEGDSHSKAHQLTKQQYDTKSMDRTANSISFRGDFFQVKGNFQEKVYTNPLFYSSIYSLDNTLRLIKEEDQHIYNLNNGAALKYTISKRVNDIATDTMPRVTKSAEILKKTLNNYSRERLTQEDIESLKQRVLFAKECKKILQEYENEPLSEYDALYRYNLISLALAILQEPTRERANLINVYDLYLSYTMPIIFDFFNTKNLQEIPKHIKKIDTIFLKELFEIERLYEEAIDSFLDEKV